MSECRHFRFVPTPEEAGIRLDQFVPAHAAELSRSHLRRVIELGGAHAGGRRVRRASYPVKAGEAVEVFLDAGALDPWRLTPEDILYRDRFLLAVNKPAGVETQPTPARYQGTLYEALLLFLLDPFRPLQKPTLGMVQRLDRETSGVILFSIHPQAHAPLTKAMSEGGARKTYLALVAGVPPAEGEINSLLARGRSDNRMKSVARGGKEAHTRYRRLDHFGGAALLEVEIATGRSHQIRVHLSEAGYPLIGDGRYGSPAALLGHPVSRHMLHAWRLQLLHPTSGEKLLLEAPLPLDFTSLLTLLRAGDLA
jgi:23S rRNA pseudouridine1911/1915/1917 synthase